MIIDFNKRKHYFDYLRNEKHVFILLFTPGQAPILHYNNVQYVFNRI
jgi:hypothetical protein